MAFDFKKEFKEFYMPKNKPEIVTVPKANYIAVRGKGNPNEEGGEYKQAVGILYPQYIVFYNGEKRQPDRVVLKLSDAFDKIEGKEPSLECKAIMRNINYGHNRSLMEKCARLEE